MGRANNMEEHQGGRELTRKKAGIYNQQILILMKLQLDEKKGFALILMKIRRVVRRQSMFTVGGLAAARERQG